jgi:type II secretion system protein N
MKERIKAYAKKYAPYVGYPIFYVACLALFIAWTFPYSKLRERFVTSFNAQQRASNGSQELQIEEMGSYWVSGVKMKGVKLLTAATQPGKAPSELTIDEARVRVSLLPLLIGHENVGFSLDAFGGQVSGTYEMHGKDRAVEVVLDSIDLGQLRPLVDLIGAPIYGKLGGSINLSLPEGRATKGSGSVELEAHDVAVGDGKAKIKNAFALPRLTVGTLSLSAEASNGILKITKLAAGGKDLELQGDGRIQMRDLAPDSICDVTVRFKVNDGYRTKEEVAKYNLFGTPGSSQTPLIELDPTVKASKRADGFYGWMVRGALGHPDFVPAGGSAATSALPSTPTPLPTLHMAPATPKVAP